MKELDLLLQRWLSQCYDAATEGQRARFAALLELPDPELADYLLHGLAPHDPDLRALLQEVLLTRPGG